MSGWRVHREQGRACSSWLRLLRTAPSRSTRPAIIRGRRRGRDEGMGRGGVGRRGDSWGRGLGRIHVPVRYVIATTLRGFRSGVAGAHISRRRLSSGWVVEIWAGSLTLNYASTHERNGGKCVGKEWLRSLGCFLPIDFTEATTVESQLVLDSTIRVYPPGGQELIHIIAEDRGCSVLCYSANGDIGSPARTGSLFPVFLVRVPTFPVDSRSRNIE